MNAEKMITEVDVVNFHGIEVKRVEIDGWECNINGKSVLFPTLQDAEKEIIRTSKTQ